MQSSLVRHLLRKCTTIENYYPTFNKELYFSVLLRCSCQAFSSYFRLCCTHNVVMKAETAAHANGTVHPTW